MKIRLSAIGLAAVIFITTPQIGLAAAPKVGAACIKFGTTQVVSNKKFTCVKSGKKLVWNKGIAVVVKPSPKPSSSPTPSPTPTPPVISLDNLDPNWTSKVALAKINEKLGSLPEATFAPEIISSPTTKHAEKDLEIKLLKPVMKLFQEYFAPTKFKVVLFTNEDSQWARQEVASQGVVTRNDIGDEITNRSSGYSICNFAFATRTSSRIPIYFECTDTRQPRDAYGYQTAPHEYFHLVHQSLAPVQTPIWLAEGSASFFGEMIGYSNFSNPLERKLKQGFITGHDFDPENLGFDPNRLEKWLPTAKPAEVSKVFKTLETEPTRARKYYSEYALGSWATEALVASYGVDGFMKLWPLLGSGQSFEVAFKTTFGLTPEEFYVKLTPYLNTRVNPKI